MFKNDIKGLNTVIKNLHKEVKKIEGKTLKGLIRAGIVVLRDVELKSPKTPVAKVMGGNLRASRFLVSSKGGVSFGRSPSFKGKKIASKLSAGHANILSEAAGIAKSGGQPTVLLGFSAYYAAPVHEMTGVTWSRPGSGGKYFEKAIDRNIKKMVSYIAKEAKIK